ncbi:hypothetical protein [Laspinema olomoucense]|uniref:hypothetical protein n=1 Tax=Laspinema olomoucense TaxID=3231600 RepID=UPI0021BAB727|nr:hypothetical protein [Laspinema sp. D3c]MCT7997194.1 hypothetical protein [Laspinema sp. D3c]
MAINIYIPSEFDNLEPEEVKLYNLVKEYRAENGLSAIPASKALSLVADWHVLDLNENVGTLTYARRIGRVGGFGENGRTQFSPTCILRFLSLLTPMVQHILHLYFTQKLGFEKGIIIL